MKIGNLLEGRWNAKRPTVACSICHPPNDNWTRSKGMNEDLQPLNLFYTLLPTILPSFFLEGTSGLRGTCATTQICNRFATSFLSSIHCLPSYRKLPHTRPSSFFFFLLILLFDFLFPRNVKG